MVQHRCTQPGPRIQRRQAWRVCHLQSPWPSFSCLHMTTEESSTVTGINNIIHGHQNLRCDLLIRSWEIQKLLRRIGSIPVGIPMGLKPGYPTSVPLSLLLVKMGSVLHPGNHKVHTSWGFCWASDQAARNRTLRMEFPLYLTTPLTSQSRGSRCQPNAFPQPSP